MFCLKALSRAAGYQSGSQQLAQGRFPPLVPGVEAFNRRPLNRPFATRTPERTRLGRCGLATRRFPDGDGKAFSERSDEPSRDRAARGTGDIIYRGCGTNRPRLMPQTIDIEVFLAGAYAVFLLLVALGLELVARHAHHRSRQMRIAGFRYHHDFWD